MPSGETGPPSRSRLLAAQAWAEMRALLDLQLSPLGLRAIEALSPRSGEVILDIGCGAGQTVMQIARLVGPDGQVVGVDIAPSLLALAREQAGSLPQASFIEGDAQRLDLPACSFDGVYSRFGVMAFADSVAAFANFHRMLKPSGRLAFVCWRTLGENELDLLPLQVTGLEALADQTPFSFDDPQRVRAILQAAGFHQIEIMPCDLAVSSGDADAMAEVLGKVGPLGRILRENPDLRADAEPRLLAALCGRRARGPVELNAATRGS